MPAATEPVASFRDPSGVLCQVSGRILRTVRAESAADVLAFLSSETVRVSVDAGELVSSKQLDSGDANLLLEHDRIFFPSYPCEWPPEMLFAAGRLTLKLAKQSLKEGFGLKDASPYNILFRGPKPVFVDIPSFERRDPLDSVWMAYGQFVRTFLLPLLALREFDLPLAPMFMLKRDGIEPETLYELASFRQRLKSPLLSLVTLPKWMRGKRDDDATLYRPHTAKSAEEARYILEGLLRSCERQLASLEPQRKSSKWTNYLDAKALYSPAELSIKEQFVRDALEFAHPQTVLDIGANDGHFSRLAARAKAQVVSIDSDAAVTGEAWRAAAKENLNILPLVADLARPTPATGWRNRENASLLDRLRGQFDMVMILALVHHLLITERIPLDDLLDLIAEISREFLLIEFIAPEDPMFIRLLRGREALYSQLTVSAFEASLTSRFEVLRSARIGDLHRWIYLLRKRRASE